MPRVQATYRARIAFPATRSNPPAQQIAAATCLSPAMHRVGRRLPLPTKKTQNPQTRLNLESWPVNKSRSNTKSGIDMAALLERSW